MTLKPEFLARLVCPEAHTPLVYFPHDDCLFNPDSRLRYPIENGFPVLLVESATRLTEKEAAELMSRAPDAGSEPAKESE